MNKCARMIRIKDHKVLEVLILCSMLGLSSGDPSIPHIPEEHVSTSLHGSVTFPCTFSFVESLEGLSVIWEKEENDKKQIVYWILKGEENLEEQDPRYRGRVELSTEFSQGNLHLILRDVTYEDEGTYYCRAANNNGHGDKKVTLSIDGAPFIPHIPEEHVSTFLHGFVTLPCTFPFVQSLEGLSVIWEKEENDKKQIVYWILKGEENLEERDPRYRGRVELSTEFPQGNLHLILRDVTYEDEGTYYCRAANIYKDGDKKVTLSIDDNEEKKESPDPEIIICAVIGIIILIIIVIIIITTIIPLLSKHNTCFIRNPKKAIFSRSCGDLVRNFTQCIKGPKKIENKPPTPDLTSITIDLLIKNTDKQAAKKINISV